ncbi:MAG: T9SS type A sorting domain-containing protein [Bacteroidetes bacterium]|nr:T9SS type A sorting domain-containing protein [Bacteroidota bacterium]
MKVLFNLVLLAGVVFLGFQTSRADEGDDKKDKQNDKSVLSTLGKDKTDTLLNHNSKEVQVDDTLVFDDYDEGNGLIAKHPATNEITVTEQTGIYNSNIKVSDNGNAGYSSNAIISDSDNNNQNISPADVHAVKTECKIYPNPASQNDAEIHVKHNLKGSVTIVITDMSGKTVNTLSSDSAEFAIDKPASGMYFVQITNGTDSETTRLIVQ